MDSLTLIGVFALVLIIVGGVSASLMAKRNDEMHRDHRH